MAKENQKEEKVYNFGWVLNEDRIAVKQLPAETVSKGGIIIPDSAQEKATVGVIVALGDGVWVDDETKLKRGGCPFAVGQTVMYGKYAGSEIPGEDKEEYIVLRVHDILGYKPIGWKPPQTT